MVSSGRQTSRKLARRRPQLAVRPRMLIVCEGEKTEPGYFDDLKRHLRISLVEIVIDDRSGVPKTLVERAVEMKRTASREARSARDKSLAFEEVWCVFDIDSHPNLPDARQQAEAHEIRLAVSNPAFELWVLLHFQNQSAFIERKPALRLCEKHLPGYSKAPTYQELERGYASAVSRAQSLDAQHARDGTLGANPSTAVHVLTQRLHEHSRASHLARVDSVRR